MGSPRFNEQWGHDLWQTRWCPHWNRGHRRWRQSQRAEANSWMEARSCAWGCHAPPESNVEAGVCCLAAFLSDSVRFWLCICLTPQRITQCEHGAYYGWTWQCRTATLEIQNFKCGPWPKMVTICNDKSDKSIWHDQWLCNIPCLIHYAIYYIFLRQHWFSTTDTLPGNPFQAKLPRHRHKGREAYHFLIWGVLLRMCRSWNKSLGSKFLSSTLWRFHPFHIPM